MTAPQGAGGRTATSGTERAVGVLNVIVAMSSIAEVYFKS